MREPANESLFTDVSRLRSYRCTIIVPTTSRAFVEREGCCASEVDKGHKRVGHQGVFTPVCDGLWAPARNVDVTKALAWRRAHASIECVNAGLTRGHGARAVDRHCGSVWAGAPLPTLQRVHLIEPS